MNKYYVTQRTYNHNGGLTIQMYWHEDENGNKVDIFFRTQTDKLYMPIRGDSIYVSLEVANVDVLKMFKMKLDSFL